MALVNPLRELVFKIVFYGPGLGGKTTTLQHIHSATTPAQRGNLVSLATDDDRTLYFDYLPIEVPGLRDMALRLQLFTVPGQVYYGATRKLVLTGAHGIVFVADSQPARLEANQESLEDLNSNLADHGRSLSQVPHSFQWNKRDLPGVVDRAELDRRLNLFSAPGTETVATTGAGVFEGLELITQLVFNSYTADLPSDRTGARRVFLDAEDVGLVGAIRALADGEHGAAVSAAAARAVPPPAANGTAAASPSQATGEAPVHRTTKPPPLSPTVSPRPGSGFSFAELWPEADRDEVRRTETLIGAREWSSAIAACELLLSRVLGEPSRDPSLLALLLGIDGPRYLSARAAMRAVRLRQEVTMEDALECFLIALECRMAIDRTLKTRVTYGR